MSGTNPTLHQSYMSVPRLDTPLIDANGSVSIPWYRFFINLWVHCGGSFVAAPNAVVLQSSGGSVQPVNAQTGQTGQMIGTVVISGTESSDPIIMETLALMPPPEISVGTAPAPPPSSDPLLAMLVVPPPDVP